MVWGWGWGREWGRSGRGQGRGAAEGEGQEAHLLSLLQPLCLPDLRLRAVACEGKLFAGEVRCGVGERGVDAVGAGWDVRPE